MNRAARFFNLHCLYNEARPFPRSTPAQCRRYETARPASVTIAIRSSLWDGTAQM